MAAELRSRLFPAQSRQNFALRNQPILILIAAAATGSRSAFQVEFISATPNLFFHVHRDRQTRCLSILADSFANFILHFRRSRNRRRNRRRNRHLSLLTALCDRAFSGFARHTVLLTGT